MLKKSVVSALLGFAFGLEQPSDEIKDYTAIFKDLETRRQNGTLKSTDAFKSMEFIANENGFRTERHQVVTEDGYILNVWRIPGKLQPGQ